MPDLPVLNLMNVNIIDETAATLAWSVFDNDGVGDHGIEIALDGTIQNNLQPSCIVDDSGISKECVTMLEVPENRSTTVEIKVTVFDEDFTSGVVEYTPSLISTQRYQLMLIQKKKRTVLQFQQPLLLPGLWD